MVLLDDVKLIEAQMRTFSSITAITTRAGVMMHGIGPKYKKGADLRSAPTENYAWCCFRRERRLEMAAPVKPITAISTKPPTSGAVRSPV